MNPTDIIALQPGKQLDEAVHAVIFNNTGPLLPYSTADTACVAILDRAPLFVGRVGPHHPKFDISRPWVAGTLTFDPNFKGDITSLRVTAGTRAVALCKAALIFTLKPAAEAPRRQPAQAVSTPASAAAAREVARRVGTKRARNPKAAAQEPPPPPKRSASTGAKPAFNRPPQPAAFRGGSAFAPMPKRPSKFVGPTPLPVAGSGMPKP